MKRRGHRVPRTRNAGTMTENMFWSMLRALLRGQTVMWKPIKECKRMSKRTYKGPNKRQKYEYECKMCGNWFHEKHITVDHIIPAGSLRNAEDLPGFVERLFVEKEGLQTLCQPCHDKKTKEDNEKLKNNRNINDKGKRDKREGL